MALEQLRPLVAERPAGDFALKLVPTYRGHIGPALPPDWVPNPQVRV